MLGGCSGEPPPEEAANPHPPPRIDCCAPPPNEVPVLITDFKDVDANVGKRVTIRGAAQFDLKMPQLLFVDVDVDEADRNLKEAEATGVLRKIVISPEWQAAEFKRVGIYATRGAGTYYSLTEATSSKHIKAHAVR